MTTDTPMTIDDFRQIDSEFRAEKPNLFRLSTPDAVASEEDIARVEQLLGVKLSPSYREFLLAYGGGNFGLTTIFSADPNGEWYIPQKHAESSEFLPKGLLAFSDDFAGGYYVLKVNDRAAEDPVYYWNQDGGLVQTGFDNMLAFVARYGYEPA